MKTLIKLLLIFCISVPAVAQQKTKLLSFDNNNLIIFHIGISGMNQKEDAKNVDHLINMNEDVCFCTTGFPDGKCRLIADKNTDMQKITDIITGPGYTVTLNMREKLTGEAFLKMYSEHNTTPRLIDTGNPEKDRHNYNTAVVLWKEQSKQ
ncbi:MAG: hypothetical protein KJ607_08320 [Bacteroidetes bacterium]|nr:hypothetical protein [Bacteroidota bacterium]